MTQPDDGFDGRPNTGPIKTPPAEVKSVARLSPRQLGAIGTILVDLLLAQVALALANVNVFGAQPFGFLKGWAEDLQKKAQDAYTGAFDAQDSANYANNQLTVLTGGALASDVTGGMSVNAQFNEASANTLTGFTRTFSDGAGGGFYGPNGSGRAVWKKSGAQTRRHIDQSNTALATDYQAVFCVMATPVQSPSLGGDAYSYLIGRMDAAGTTFVYARIGNNDLAVGKVVSGTWSAPWASVAITTKPGDQWTFLLGTNTDDREFIVKQNGVVRITHTDTTSSAFGSNYRRVGLGALAANRATLLNLFDQTVPGELEMWAAADRQSSSV